MDALVLNLQRLSTEDGPGIRTTVFFKGCPLSCAWCHNPECISSRPQVHWLENRCLRCETCLLSCPDHCLSMGVDGIRIDRERCDGCGRCARECPSNALQLLGEKKTLEEILQLLLKDRIYYEKSGGGVTVSGGEPTLQAEFVAALFDHLHQSGIHTALDTCGICSTRRLEIVLADTDLILYDLKLMDAARHFECTGQSNQLILENLIWISDYLRSHAPEKKLWIRTPLIPGSTATEQNLLELGAFIASHLNGLLDRWELCAFNNLCRDKYRRLGLRWTYENTPLLTQETLTYLEQVARQSGPDPSRILATGAVRAEVGGAS